MFAALQLTGIKPGAFGWGGIYRTLGVARPLTYVSGFVTRAINCGAKYFEIAAAFGLAMTNPAIKMAGLT